MKLIKAIIWSAVMIVPVAGIVGCMTGNAGLGFPQKMASCGTSSGEETDRVAQNPRMPMPDSSVADLQHKNSNQVAPQLPGRQPELVSFVQNTNFAQDTRREAPTRPITGLVTLATNENLYERVGNSSGVVLVDFYADWCGPCRKQGGILHEMESLAGQNGALIIKVNVDQHQDLANEFQVSSLPTLMLMKNGQVISRQAGLADHQRIASLLEQ